MSKWMNVCLCRYLDADYVIEKIAYSLMSLNVSRTVALFFLFKTINTPDSEVARGEQVKIVTILSI